jgi:hypothetical protein
LWYFHKSRGQYRGGSFKGVDITFGHANATGGILIRGIAKPNDELVDGPSLTVDYLLQSAGFADVRSLDSAIARRRAWDAGNPLGLAVVREAENRQIYQSPRVGLSLKRPGLTEGPRYVMSPYRFLTEPKRIRKGKTLLILGLHAAGCSPRQIQALTGTPQNAIQRATAASDAAQAVVDWQEFVSQELTPKSLCRLHGVWQAAFGSRSRG